MANFSSGIKINEFYFVFHSLIRNFVGEIHNIMKRRDFLALSATGIVGLGLSSFPLSMLAKGRGEKSYSLILLGDTHFDVDPATVYHANYMEKTDWLNKVQRAEFARNGEMWKDRCPRLLRGYRPQRANASIPVSFRMIPVVYKSLRNYLSLSGLSTLHKSCFLSARPTLVA